MGTWVVVKTTFNDTPTPRHVEGERRWIEDDAQAQRLHDKGWVTKEGEDGKPIDAPAEVTLDIHEANNGQSATEV